MPVTADLPPFPSHDAFEGLREQVEEAIREASDKRFIEFCVDVRRTWSKFAPLLSADLGTPTKKLTAAERAEKRRLDAAGIGEDDIAALTGWFDAAIQAVRLSHARAA